MPSGSITPWRKTRIGSLSMKSCAALLRVRVIATAAWQPNSVASTARPSSSGVVPERAVEAMIEPTAMVIAKSKLDIFAKLRTPWIRQNRITAA